MNNLFTPEHLKEVCPACKKAHNKDWKAEFFKEIHYKMLICECGYKIFFSTPEVNSGHY